MNLIDVPRNDIAAARRYYQERGRITGDEVHILLRLQDEPDNLIAVMERERWEVVSRDGDDT